jgi:hypothetical protein
MKGLFITCLAVIAGTARVRVTGRQPDPERTRAAAREIDEPL